MIAEKQLLRLSFGRAAPRYDDVADYQREAGERLMAECAIATAPRVVLDAGSKSLSSDLMGMDGYGLVMGTDLVITTLSEEHGVIEMPAASDWPRIGDRLRIIPNHACVVSNLFDTVTLVSGDTVTGTFKVASRGRVD